MDRTDPRTEEYFNQVKNWREEQAGLRAILLETPLVEGFKWNSPCFSFGNGNVATIWGMKDHCALAFFKGILLKDEAGLLVAPGKNSRAMRKIIFTSTADIARLKDQLIGYVEQAIELEQAGRKVDFRQDEPLAYPEELQNRFRQNSDLQTAFEQLTPGRQRGYILHFSQPKRAETRFSRIDRWIPAILAGKGLQDR